MLHKPLYSWHSGLSFERFFNFIKFHQKTDRSRSNCTCPTPKFVRHFESRRRALITEYVPCCQWSERPPWFLWCPGGPSIQIKWETAWHSLACKWPLAPGVMLWSCHSVRPSIHMPLICMLQYKALAWEVKRCCYTFNASGSVHSSRIRFLRFFENKKKHDFLHFFEAAFKNVIHNSKFQTLLTFHCMEFPLQLKNKLNNVCL